MRLKFWLSAMYAFLTVIGVNLLAVTLLSVAWGQFSIFPFLFTSICLRGFIYTIVAVILGIATFQIYRRLAVDEIIATPLIISALAAVIVFVGIPLICTKGLGPWGDQPAFAVLYLWLGLQGIAVASAFGAGYGQRDQSHQI